MLRNWRTIVAATVSLTCVTCTGAEVTVIGPGHGAGTTGTGQPAYSITLNTTAQTISVGAATTLIATVRDSLGIVVPAAVVGWSSGNSGVASVNASGVVTGVAPGNVSIGASFSGVTATALITVVTVPVATVQVVPSADTLQVSTSVQLTAVPRDANGNVLTGRSIAWSSNNAPAASVTTNGLVVANAVGVATITAISEGQVGTATITVVNIPVATVTVTPATDTMFTGQQQTLSATAFDASNNPLTGRPVTWSSSAPSILSVNTSGLVTAVAAGGPVTITATIGGVNGTSSITVIVVPVASVTVAPPTASVQAGATTVLVATARDSVGGALPGRPIAWSSGNTGIATVNTSGVVTGVTPGGPVTITASSGGQNGTASITVTQPPPTLVRVVLTPPTATINAGTTQQFTAQGKMSDSSLQTISISFTAQGGTITQAGLYTAGGAAGTFNVIASAQGAPKADTSQVTVVVPPPATVASVTVAPPTASVAVAGSVTLAATARDSANNVLTGRTFTWTSGNTGVATVNASGVVTGVAVGGPVTITAATGGQSGTAAVTVVVVPVASITVTPGAPSVQVGGTVALTATLRDSAGNVLTGRPITWASANTGIATVNTSGVVTAVAAGGPVAVSATSGTASGSSNVTVTAPAATLVRVILQPDTATVLAGGTKAFVAQGKMSDSSVQSISVTFTAAGGTVTQGGVYTAGGTTGIFNVIAAAQGQPKADTSHVTIVASPPPGSYTTVVGDDWSSYGSSAILLSTFGWGSTGPSTLFTVPANVHLVPDPVFGQVVETRQPMDTSTQVCCGWSPLKFVGFPRLLDKAWFRVKVRFSPGWTPVGPIPAGAANSYKLLFQLWQGYSQRAEVEFSNNTAYIIGFGFQGVTCNTVAVPGAVPWGQVTTEWTGGEWWEYIMYYEKLGVDGARQRFWKRQLTVNHVINPQPFEFTGEEKSNCSSPTPQTRAINLGANKNKTTPADQYIYWGPFEVVDGVQYPNPWGVGP